MPRTYTERRRRGRGKSSRRQAVLSESESEQDSNAAEAGGDISMTDYAGGRNVGEDEGDDLHRQIAKNLIRFALACDYQRIPIRRTAFREKFMAEHPRAWKKAFELAQKKLRETFGMEMRELPIREKLTMEEKRKAANTNTTTKSSDSYILISLLPPQYRTATLIPPSSTPTADSEAHYAGFYTLVVTFIVLHGGEITDPRLRRYLQRTDPDLDTQKTNELLARCERQGYVVKKVEKNAYSAADEEKNMSYLVGPRGKVELQAENIAGFIRATYQQSSAVLEKQIAATLGVEEQILALSQVEREEEEESEGGGEDEDEEMDAGPSQRTRRR